MRDISRAVQVNIDDNVPIVQIHFFEGLVPQNASVIDRMSMVRILRQRHRRCFWRLLGQKLKLIGNGYPTLFSDFLNHLICHITRAKSIRGAAQVIDNDFRALFANSSA